MEICGYTITETLNDSSRTLVYRGSRAETGNSAVLKLLRNKYPSPADLAGIRHEFEICSLFQHNKIIRAVGLDEHEHNLVIIFDDFDGIPLPTRSSPHREHLVGFLDLALQLTDGLREIHRRKVIYKNLCPANTLYRSLTGRIKLIDFSLATTAEREYPFRSANPIPDGTLAYISPEQSGRLDKSLDYRSDFYSLGVTLYELLTGEVPFTAADPMELVHCHLAKTPVPPHETNHAIPETISRIILKLLEKSADKRYQSCSGLASDLMKCLIELKDTHSIVDFSVGRDDVATHFTIPDRLYGRQDELRTIHQAYDAACNGAKKTLFVTGCSGIGKTALVLEAQKIMEARGGSFIRGKFDQIHQDIPYAPLIHGFRELVQKILLTSARDITRWKRVLSAALGCNGRVIIDVIPEVELIIGAQPPLEELSPVENKHRFKLVFQRFIEACANQAGTLVFFFDDMHWTDPDTLELIEHLIVAPAIPGMLIGSYRDNEVSPSHPLITTIERLVRHGSDIEMLHLDPLLAQDVATLLSESLYCPIPSVMPLARICLDKTDGNPFYLKQFLQALYDSDHLTFDIMSGRWNIDFQYVETMKVMPNVGEILTRRISGFSPALQHILKCAACIGNEFDLATLAAINRKSRQQTRHELSKAIQEGLILQHQSRQGSTYDGSNQQAQTSAEPIFIFAHDQIQKAVHALIPGPERNGFHLRIGKFMQQALTPEQREKRLFDIIGHFNFGSALLASDDERVELARLNLQAAQKAKNSAAYRPYYRFAKTGLGLLPTDSWETHYRLTLDIYTETAEAATLNGLRDETERIYVTVISQARDLLDKTRIYQIKIRSCKAANRLHEAVATGLEILAEFGVTFPNNPGRLHILAAMLATRLLLVGKKTQDLLNLPQMTDPYKKAAMAFLLDIGTAAYYTKPALIPLIGFTAVRLSLKYGNTIASAVMGYPTYGFLLCGLTPGNLATGYEFGILALNLQKRLEQGANPLPIYLVHNLITHWQKHINTTIGPILEAYRLSLNCGELEIAANCAYSYSYRIFFLGQELESIEEELKIYREAIDRVEQKIALYRQLIFQQTVHNLLGKSEDPVALDGTFYNRDIMLPMHRKGNDHTTLFLFHLMSMIQAYLFEKYHEADDHGAAANRLLASVISSLFVPIFFFYRTLTILALYPSLPTIKQGGRLKTVNAGLKKMRRWSAASPDNYRHKYHLMAAELNRVFGRNESAAGHYDRAIRYARQSGYLQEEALGYERAAAFYLRLGRPLVAQPYLDEAIYCYRRWGAAALVNYLGQKISRRNHGAESGAAARSWLPVPRGQARPGEYGPQLDMTSVIKASRTFTDEIVLDELLKKLIMILLENAGGEVGFLLLNISKTWVVKAKAAIGDHEGTILNAPPLVFRHMMSQSIVNYVIRSKKTVVLNNACEQGLFTADRYILEHRPQSILAMPILHHGEITGLLYLENNLTTGAFQPDRLEILNLIGSQAAISIRNSLLYEELEGTIRELHHEVGKRKETQMQLLHAGKLSALGRLSASIAHEFGNPLIGIKYLLDDLGRREELGSEDKKLIRIGLEECERMRSLINDLHDLHRPSTGARTRFNLNDTVKNVLLFQRKNLKTIGVTVKTDLDPNLPDLRAIEDQITQVVVNLTINAADAMEERGGTLLIKTSHRDELVELSITDSGCGIPPEHQEHLFEPFFSTKKEADGTGLGLAISYSIITSHHGEIDFTSTPGAGSTFTIQLPCPQPSA